MRYRVAMAETFHMHPRALDDMHVSEFDQFTHEIDRRVDEEKKAARTSRRR